MNMKTTTADIRRFAHASAMSVPAAMNAATATPTIPMTAFPVLNSCRYLFTVTPCIRGY